MPLENDYVFRKSLETSTDIYTTISNLASKARNLADETDNEILHSEAITCILHDTKPKKTKWSKGDDEYEAIMIRDLFCMIEDKEICDAVYDSYYDSKDANHLIYVYNQISDKSKQARVRILTRMLWYQLVKL